MRIMKEYNVDTVVGKLFTTIKNEQNAPIGKGTFYYDKITDKKKD